MVEKSKEAKARVLGELERIEFRVTKYPQDGDGKITTDLILLLRRGYDDLDFDPATLDRDYLIEIDNSLMRMLERVESRRLKEFLSKKLDELRPNIY